MNGAPANAPDVTGTVFDDDQPEVTRSYAEALLGAAASEGQTEAVLDELDELVADVLRGHPKFAAMLASESLPATEKDRILTATFEDRASPLVVRFLRVLNRHGRLGLIAPIARAARAELGPPAEPPAGARSARPIALDDAQRQALFERLSRMLAATPVLRTGRSRPDRGAGRPDRRRRLRRLGAQPAPTAPQSTDRRKNA